MKPRGYHKAAPVGIVGDAIIHVERTRLGSSKNNVWFSQRELRPTQKGVNALSSTKDHLSLYKIGTRHCVGHPSDGSGQTTIKFQTEVHYQRSHLICLSQLQAILRFGTRVQHRDQDALVLKSISRNGIIWGSKPTFLGTTCASPITHPANAVCREIWDLSELSFQSESVLRTASQVHSPDIHN